MCAWTQKDVMGFANSWSTSWKITWLWYIPAKLRGKKIALTDADKFDTTLQVNLPDNVDEAFCKKELSILWSDRTVRNSFAVVINLRLCLHMLLTIIIITGPWLWRYLLLFYTGYV